MSSHRKDNLHSDDHFHNNADDDGDGHADDDEYSEGDSPRFHRQRDRGERFGLSQESSQVSDGEMTEDNGDFTLTWKQEQQGRQKKRKG